MNSTQYIFLGEILIKSRQARVNSYVGGALTTDEVIEALKEAEKIIEANR